MKATESTRLKAEGSLREELDVRWQKLQELDEARVQAMLEQCQVKGHPVILLLWAVGGEEEEGGAGSASGQDSGKGGASGEEERGCRRWAGRMRGRGRGVTWRGVIVGGA